jgi:hypothetical protein
LCTCGIFGHSTPLCIVVVALMLLVFFVILVDRSFFGRCCPVPTKKMTAVLISLFVDVRSHSLSHPLVAALNRPSFHFSFHRPTPLTRLAKCIALRISYDISNDIYKHFPLGGRRGWKHSDFLGSSYFYYFYFLKKEGEKEEEERTFLRAGDWCETRPIKEGGQHSDGQKFAHKVLDVAHSNILHLPKHTTSRKLFMPKIQSFISYLSNFGPFPNWTSRKQSKKKRIRKQIEKNPMVGGGGKQKFAQYVWVHPSLSTWSKSISLSKSP